MSRSVIVAKRSDSIEAAAPVTPGAIFRREGIYSSQLSAWRRQLERGDLDVTNARAREKCKDDATASTRRIVELESEIRKVRHRVERAEAIVEIQKKRTRRVSRDALALSENRLRKFRPDATNCGSPRERSRTREGSHADRRDDDGAQMCVRLGWR